ncbi:MAG TPA: ABC transporter ATP-binding protein, partial [Bryobacteraceae bacterium]|nr:ABC transporter ATP-binding protein [Bryobacteraceae bacterium]
MRQASQADSMPAALPSMWRALLRAREAEPRLLAVSFCLALLAALPDALLALWLGLLADGILGAKRGQVTAAAIGLGASAAATWFLRVVSDRTSRQFRERITITLEALVARLQASVAGIEHHERQEYVDRLAMLRNQVFVLDHMYWSLFTTCGWLLRLIVTLGLLVSVHPALALLALFAVPTVVTSTWRPEVERKADERGTWSHRLSRHLFDVATTAPPGKEVRVTRIGPSLIEQRRAAWEFWYGPVAAARRGSALWQALSWAVFGAAYVAAVVFVSSVVKATPGSVLLVLAAGARLSAYIGAAVGEIGFLRGFWLDGSRRLAWLEDYAASFAQGAESPAPEAIRQGIDFEHVCFSYPGTDRLVLENVNLHFAPGSVVAIVGENGAGKTTLVKLLCRLYQPSSGRILVDGVDLARIAPEAWRSRLAGAFQDFFRFEFRALNSVGIGDLPRHEDVPAVTAAILHAGADDVVANLGHGLETQLGPTWPEGVEISFGQWQKLALARGFMRERPLVLILDEPTAALDAETEHKLFERFAAAARQRAADGRITILISHRFSTVRMADFIVVLDGSRVVESGSHEELMTKAGPYS